MEFRFPLNDVNIKMVELQTKVSAPLFSDEWNEINEREFSLDVEGVAWFYVKDGNYIEIVPYNSYDLHTLELYLNSSVYGAILHQRKILPLHGSSFIYNGKGVMVCGESGAGKSSVTVAFCLSGSRFLTDDVSIIINKMNLPFIQPLSDKVKLWNDSLEQLNINKDGLVQITQETEKFYFPFPTDAEKEENYLLSYLFLLELYDGPDVSFRELTGAEKLTILRNQIYRIEYLLGMPENEKHLFNLLSLISKNVKLIQVKRPAEIPIHKMMQLIKSQLE